MQGSIELPGVLTEFGMSLHGLAAATQDPEVAGQARGVLRDAVEAGLEIAPAQALDGALAWRRLALDGPEPWHDMATASDAALTALRKLLRSQLFRANKEAWLRTTLDVSASAAVAHANTGALRHAVVTLESGRGLILVEGLPPVGLERSQPQLFARLKACDNIGNDPGSTHRGCGPSRPRPPGPRQPVGLGWASHAMIWLRVLARAVRRRITSSSRPLPGSRLTVASPVSPASSSRTARHMSAATTAARASPAWVGDRAAPAARP